MVKKYTEEEIQTIDRLYNGDKVQGTVQQIANEINDIFHKGKPVRSRRSIYYALDKNYER